MEGNDIFKKFMDSAMGMANVMAEKLTDFTGQMVEKGKEFKESKQGDIDKFLAAAKAKFEETATKLSTAINLKAKRVDELEERVKLLESDLADIKKQLKTPAAPKEKK